MTRKERKLVAEAEEFAADNGLEVELEVLRDMLAKGDPLSMVSFLMRDRYPMDMLKALRTQLREQKKVAAAR